MDNLLWLSQFHFIRPLWLLMSIPLFFLIWFSAQQIKHNKNWTSVIDKRLLPHLLQSAPVINKRNSSLGLFFISSLIIISLAGPAIEKRPQPVFKNQSALVIILDLSQSMNATDIKPNRLSRAHFKINDILKLRKEGQTALIVYAADAYTVSPLTDDTATIIAQIPALQPNIMPRQGSRLDIALDKANALFINAGHTQGNILILTDSVKEKDLIKIKSLASHNYNSSILAIGTEQGAPIATDNGGFVKDSRGAIVIPKLNISRMQQAAHSGNGRFSLLTVNDNDINALLYSINSATIDKQESPQTDATGNKLITDIWHEEGPWLLLLVIPFAAYAFRKGLVFALIVFILPIPQPASAGIWNDLWQNDNQRASAELQQGNAKEAAALFDNTQWKAAAHYKAGEYQEAADLLESDSSEDANYNRGNALAKLQQFEQAIEAYDTVLSINPEHEDAKHNKTLLEQAQQNQEENDSQDSDKKNQGENKNKDSDKQAEQNGKSDSSNNGEPSNNDESTESSENNNSEQQAENDPTKNTNSEKEDNTRPSTENTDSKDAETDKESTAMSQKESDIEPDLEQQQTQQWLKKIPDDPGGLLRRKFKYIYGRDQGNSEANPW